VHLFSLQTGLHRFTLNGHTTRVVDCHIAEDRLVTLADFTAIVWDATTGTQLFATDDTLTIGLSPNGQYGIFRSLYDTCKYTVKATSPYTLNITRQFRSCCQPRFVFFDTISDQYQDTGVEYKCQDAQTITQLSVITGTELKLNQFRYSGNSVVLTVTPTNQILVVRKPDPVILSLILATRRRRDIPILPSYLIALIHFEFVTINRESN
jgi:hypothetical protein